MENPETFTQDSVHMQQIERFVILMYSKACGAASVNEARQRLFTSGSRSLENIPPTQAALFQHVKRALLQGSFFWRQATSVHQEIPNFGAWGWYKDDSNKWQPLRTTLLTHLWHVPFFTVLVENPAPEGASATVQVLCPFHTDANYSCELFARIPIHTNATRFSAGNVITSVMCHTVIRVL